MRSMALGTDVRVDGIIIIRAERAPALDSVMYPVHRLPRTVRARSDARLWMTAQAKAREFCGVFRDPSRRGEVPARRRAIVVILVDKIYSDIGHDIKRILVYIV